MRWCLPSTQGESSAGRVPGNVTDYLLFIHDRFRTVGSALTVLATRPIGQFVGGSTLLFLLPAGKRK